MATIPEARGRSERAFGTMQGGRVPELRRAGVKSYEGANRYLQEVFIPEIQSKRSTWRTFPVSSSSMTGAMTFSAGWPVARLIGSFRPLFHHGIAQNTDLLYFDFHYVSVVDSSHSARGAGCDYVARH